MYPIQLPPRRDRDTERTTPVPIYDYDESVIIVPYAKLTSRSRKLSAKLFGRNHEPHSCAVIHFVIQNNGRSSSCSRSPAKEVPELHHNDMRCAHIGENDIAASSHPLISYVCTFECTSSPYSLVNTYIFF